MIYVIIYLLVAAASVFCFCVVKVEAGAGKSDFPVCEYFVPPIIWGFLWPLGWPIYSPYLAAVWFLRKKEYNGKAD